jgi:hypothetical protein
MRPNTLSDRRHQKSIRPQLSPGTTSRDIRAYQWISWLFRLKYQGNANVKDMHIRLIDDVPVSYRPYRFAYSKRALVREIVKDLMDNGIIRESESPYSSPILTVKKKTGEYRMCVDYRLLNAKTVKDTYPCGTSHITDNRQVSVSRQRLVTFMSVVTQQYVA